MELVFGDIGHLFLDLCQFYQGAINSIFFKKMYPLNTFMCSNLIYLLTAKKLYNFLSLSFTDSELDVNLDHIYFYLQNLEFSSQKTTIKRATPRGQC